MCKKILVIIGMVLFVSFKITNLHADSLQIIPPQKPTLSSEEKIKKISKNIITPLKKPSKLKKVEKKIVTKEFKEKKLSFKEPKTVLHRLVHTTSPFYADTSLQQPLIRGTLGTTRGGQPT